MSILLVLPCSSEHSNARRTNGLPTSISRTSFLLIPLRDCPLIRVIIALMLITFRCSACSGWLFLYLSHSPTSSPPSAPPSLSSPAVEVQLLLNSHAAPPSLMPRTIQPLSHISSFNPSSPRASSFSSSSGALRSSVMAKGTVPSAWHNSSHTGVSYSPSSILPMAAASALSSTGTASTDLTMSPMAIRPQSAAGLLWRMSDTTGPLCGTTLMVRPTLVQTMVDLLC
mmetsp:Transcript_19313/g.44292  ORF Transcript_19313/g.44292 Transcript_19313/m.44292 type:complete len:227 (-) Transcript_19313:324-1004(-)